MSNQVATAPFRKIEAVELYGTNAALGVSGNPVIAGHAAPSAMLRGANSSTGTGATTFTGMGAQGSGIKIYVTSLQITRSDSGSTAITVTLNDTATSIFAIPNAGNGGGAVFVFPVPLVVAANTAFQFTSGTGVSTLYCCAQGYSGA